MPLNTLAGLHFALWKALAIKRDLKTINFSVVACISAIAALNAGCSMETKELQNSESRKAAFEGQWRAIAKPDFWPGSGLIELKIEPISSSDELSIQFIGQERFIYSPLSRASAVLEDGQLKAQFGTFFDTIYGPVDHPVRAEIRLTDQDTLDVILTDQSRSVQLDFQPADDPHFSKFDIPRLNTAGHPVRDYSYHAPQADRPFAMADAGEMDVDVTHIEKMMRYLLSDQDVFRAASTILIKDGKLIVEEYFRGLKADNRHHIMSVTKSIVSLLYGQELAQGHVFSPQTPVRSVIDAHFPDHTDSAFYRSADNIVKMDHILRMSNLSNFGDEFYEGDAQSVPSLMTWMNGDERPRWLDFQFDQSVSMPHERWTEFHYNSLYTQLLGETIWRANDCVSLEKIIKTQMFDALNISNFNWSKQWGIPHADSCSNSAPVPENSFGGLMMTPMDMAKIGQLVLQRGKWDGKQLVPEDWLIRSTTVQSLPHPNMPWQSVGYGYQWWLASFRLADDAEAQITWAIIASGFGGQLILIIPDYNAVVVTTAFHFDQPSGEEILLANYVLPAISGGKTFTPVPVTAELLGSRTLAR